MAKKGGTDAAVRAHGWGDKRERSEIIKWKKGTVVVGRFLGLTEGRGKFNSPLLRMSVDGKVEVYGAPRYLVGYVEGISVNTEMRIECLGQTIPSDKGNDAFDFDVRTKD